MKPITLFTLLFNLSAAVCAGAQTPTPAKNRICMDVAHHQTFWGDPADMDEKRVERVEACPICGRTGDYSGHPGNLVELVHDPLGLELLLGGTIRGERVRFEDYGQREVGSIGGLGDKFSVSSLVFPGMTGDRNTLRLGTVVITARK